MIDTKHIHKSHFCYSYFLLTFLLLLCLEFIGQAQTQWRVVYDSNDADRYAASELCSLLQEGGIGVLCEEYDGEEVNKSLLPSIFIGRQVVRQNGSMNVHQSMGLLRDDGYLIVGDKSQMFLMGNGKKGTLYAVYAFLEQLGYRLYTPDALVVPKMISATLPSLHIVSNPSFRYREVRYRYPNCSQRYADWHHLHNDADRMNEWGFFVHSFNTLLPPSRYFENHPDWYSWRDDRRVRDGQLCLSNPQVLDSLCSHLADSMAAHPEKKIWSVSNNDNYNVCQCPNCLHQDSLYGGPTGTLLHFVNQVARRFPDKTISTLAYQYTRKTPKDNAIQPDSNVNIMFCSIECGRETPIAISPQESSFRKDMEDWHRITDNIFMWDYIVQYRNYWNPFPNLHVIQPNLRFFYDHGVRMIFEQGSDTVDRSSWMDIRCYMTAKLLWDVNIDIDSVMTDFYNGYYGSAGKYVRTIVDTMSSAVATSGKQLDIYGFPIDGATTYLSPRRMHLYRATIDSAYSALAVNNQAYHIDRLDYFRMALDFAQIELNAKNGVDTLMLHRLVDDMQRFKVPKLMEYGVTPEQYLATMRNFVRKSTGVNYAFAAPITLRKIPTPPYTCQRGASLVDHKGGLLDFRNDWIGFWGDTLDAIISLDSTRILHQTTIDFFYYPLSWIFLPQQIECYLSDDAVHWQQVGTINPTGIQMLALPEIHTATFDLKNTTARYLRIVALPLSEIPSWHRAAGKKAWMFTDEIVVQ